MDYNKAIVAGNLTRDPEIRSLPSGKSVCNLSIASNRRWTDSDGQKQSEAEFHNIVIFGKMADTVNQYMKKGSEMLIEGRLKTSSWDDKNNGSKRYRTEIVAENVVFGSKRDGNNNIQEQEQSSNQPQEDDINIEDIPF